MGETWLFVGEMGSSGWRPFICAGDVENAISWARGYPEVVGAVFSPLVISKTSPPRGNWDQSVLEIINSVGFAFGLCI